jgi:hypothetical protein
LIKCELRAGITSVLIHIADHPTEEQNHRRCEKGK